jgi:hypothetical protein
MPDYDIVESLCEELEITVVELMNGEDAKEKNVKIYDDQIVDLLKRTKELEKQKHVLSGTILIVMGIAIQAVSYSIGGSIIKDFLSGFLLRFSILEMLIGLSITVKYITQKQKKTP